MNSDHHPSVLLCDSELTGRFVHSDGERHSWLGLASTRVPGYRGVACFMDRAVRSSRRNVTGRIALLAFGLLIVAGSPAVASASSHGRYCRIFGHRVYDSFTGRE